MDMVNPLTTDTLSPSPNQRNVTRLYLPVVGVTNTLSLFSCTTGCTGAGACTTGSASGSTTGVTTGAGCSVTVTTSGVNSSETVVSVTVNSSVGVTSVTCSSATTGAGAEVVLKSCPAKCLYKKNPQTHKKMTSNTIKNNHMSLLEDGFVSNSSELFVIESPIKSGRRESNPRLKLGKLPFYH